jgi:hypothetical protein
VFVAEAMRLERHFSTGAAEVGAPMAIVSGEAGA